MRVDRHGIQADVPTGWQLRISRRPSGELKVDTRVPADPVPDGGIARPVMHACSRALPDDIGDFGAGGVDLLGVDDVFVALLEYDPALAGTGLFERRGVPRLAPSQFSPARLQRYLPGMSASQHFFTAADRTFCLYTVLGAHARRMALVPRADAVAGSLRIARGNAPTTEVPTS